ncbi:MAG: type IV pilus assembly protein PilM [Patescibacteria group bacterium]|nr:type IV pilus assembly protein PilM [Patescibacteria group bacterium]
MNSFFGLDIGLTQVKVLQAGKNNQGLVVEKLAIVKFDPKNKVLAIKQALKEAGIKGVAEVNVALAESEVFSKIIETPKLSTTELASSIQYEAEQYIPVALTEVELFHQVLSVQEGSDEKIMKVLLIAVPKTRMNSLLNLIDQAELIPKSLETELFSVQRIVGDENKTQILLSCGYKTTDLMILNKGIPVFTFSINVGGLALTKSLMIQLNLPIDQAEEYKKTYGMRTDLLEGKIAKILTLVVDEIVSQINKAMMFLQQQGFNKPPEELVLTGGGALLPGLSAYLAAKLNLEVVVGNPFAKFVKDEAFIKLITQESNPQLATVAGLAVKGLI